MSSGKRPDFEEIGHSGGTISIQVAKTETGRAYQLTYSNSRPNAAALFSIYALPQGIAVETVPAGGMGVPIPAPKVPGSYMIFVPSDREGMFGRSCRWCDRYWRADTIPLESGGCCPYCGESPKGTLHLTEAQDRYVEGVCKLMSEALDAEPGTHIIDLDAVADAVEKEGEKPPFYSSDERQQTLRPCEACGYIQDVIGRTSYCCVCRSRNDLPVLAADLEKARSRAREGALDGALRDAVSAFDGFVDTMTAELRRRTPLSRPRAAYWSGGRGRARHNLPDLLAKLDEHFGFKTATALSGGELKDAARMIERRHVHEHRGGVVDQKYLDATGDETVRLGQILQEQPDEVFQTIGSLSKIAAAIASGFSELYPPSQEAIDRSIRKPRKA